MTKQNEIIKTEVDVNYPSLGGGYGGSWLKSIKRVRHYDKPGIFGYLKHHEEVLCELKIKETAISADSDRVKDLKKVLERVFKY